MFMCGVRRLAVLGLIAAGGAFPAACLFAPNDYSGLTNDGEGGCSSANGCVAPTDCRILSCNGMTCDTTNAPADRAIPQVPHDCKKRQCDGQGNVVEVAEPDDLPLNDGNGCTVEDCDDKTPPNVPAGTACPGGFCDGLGVCATCGDGLRNGDETGVDCGGAHCATCDGAACVGGPTGCLSGHCADGVCCAMKCDKKCEACLEALTGMPDGTCAPVLLGKQDGTACLGLGGCGEMNHCACEDGVENQGELGVDCGGPCAPGCGAGTPCEFAFNCASASCASGVCCQTACDGHCDRCDAPGHVGQCTHLPALSQGTCDATLACDGNGACRKQNGQSCQTSTECASGLCAGGTCS